VLAVHALGVDSGEDVGAVSHPPDDLASMSARTKPDGPGDHIEDRMGLMVPPDDGVGSGGV
jgi:hypothetical protein